MQTSKTASLRVVAVATFLLYNAASVTCAAPMTSLIAPQVASAPKQTASLTPAQAVTQAEAFIAANGYTSTPATLSERELAHETVEFARSTAELLKRRRNSLQPTACGYRPGRRGDAKGWTVVFRRSEARPATNAALGRAVTMELEGSRKRVEHSDARLADFTSWPEPTAPQTPAAQTPPVSVSIPAWTPDATLVAKLAPSADAGSGFQIQPPVGYVPQTATAPNGSGNLKAWVGPARADGSHGTLLVTTLTPPPADAAKATPAMVLDKMLEGIARRRKNGKRTPTETGTVAGQAFVRARWEGTDTTTGLLMRGFAYVTKSGATFIQVSSQDIAPHDKDALPLAEASTLTFKKPLAPSTPVAPAAAPPQR